MIENRVVNSVLLAKAAVPLSQPAALFICIGIFAIAFTIARSRFTPMKLVEMVQASAYAAVSCLILLLAGMIVFSPIAIPILVDLAATNGFILVCAVALLLGSAIVSSIEKRRPAIGAWWKVSAFAATLSLSLGFAWMVKAYTPSNDLDLMASKASDQFLVGQTCYSLSLIPLPRRRNYFGGFQEANSVPQHGTFLVRAMLTPQTPPSPGPKKPAAAKLLCGKQSPRVIAGTTLSPVLQGSFMTPSAVDEFPVTVSGTNGRAWEWFVRPEETGWQSIHLELLASSRDSSGRTIQDKIPLLGVAAPLWVEGGAASPMVAINTLSTIVSIVAGVVALITGVLGMRKDLTSPDSPVGDVGQ